MALLNYIKFKISCPQIKDMIKNMDIHPIIGIMNCCKTIITYLCRKFPDIIQLLSTDLFKRKVKCLYIYFIGYFLIFSLLVSYSFLEKCVTLNGLKKKMSFLSFGCQNPEIWMWAGLITFEDCENKSVHSPYRCLWFVGNFWSHFTCSGIILKFFLIFTRGSPCLFT